MGLGKFRIEAAKDFVSAIISNPQWIYGAEGGGLFKNKESVISNAIMYADELIRQLKEEQR